MPKENKWTPILGKPQFDKSEYAKIYDSEFVNEIINDFKIVDAAAKEEMAEALLYAAFNYEFQKHNYHHFYKNKTDVRKQLNEFKVGLTKTLKSFQKLKGPDGGLSFAKFIFALKKRYLKDKPDILNTNLVHPTDIYLSELKRLENLLDLFIKSCDDAVSDAEHSPKIDPTFPLEDWLHPIRYVWAKYQFPITYTEGNPDYADYSAASKVLHKIIQKIDPNVDISTIAWVIKRTKNKPLST